MKQGRFTLVELMVIIAICVIVVAIALPNLLSLPSPERAAASAARQKTEQNILIDREVKILVEYIYYFEDPRTGLCFAYCMVGSGYDTLSFTLVPREKIPPELLHTIKIEE